MSINTRIREIINALGESESAFAKRIDVSTSVIFNMVNPKGRMSYPSGAVLEKLLNLELDSKKISAEWLMRGEGDMLSQGQQISSPEAALDYLRATIIQLKDNK